MKVGDKVRFKDGIYSYKSDYTSDVIGTIIQISEEKLDLFPIKIKVHTKYEDTRWDDVALNLELIEESK